MTYATILKKLEDARGPDRELDLAIACIHFKCDEDRFLTDTLERRQFGHQFPYTGALDYALKLVPADWRVHSISESYEGWSACLHRKYGSHEADHEQWKRFHSWPQELGNVSSERKPTAAIAVCLAALRARAASAAKES